MLLAIKHLYRVANAQFREHVIKGVIHPIIGKRSGAWPTTRRSFLNSNPTCAACGGTTLLNVHHKEPFHLYPKLELEPKNLITLCMGKWECHLLIGHGDDFKAYNPDVEAHARLVLKQPAKRKQVEDEAKEGKRYVLEG